MIVTSPVNLISMEVHVSIFVIVTQKEDKKSLVSTETESINSGEKQDEFQQIKGDKKHTYITINP